MLLHFLLCWCLIHWAAAIGHFHFGRLCFGNKKWLCSTDSYELPLQHTAVKGDERVLKDVWLCCARWEKPFIINETHCVIVIWGTNSHMVEWILEWRAEYHLLSCVPASWDVLWRYCVRGASLCWNKPPRQALLMEVAIVMEVKGFCVCIYINSACTLTQYPASSVSHF